MSTAEIVIDRNVGQEMFLNMLNRWWDDLCVQCGVDPREKFYEDCGYLVVELAKNGARHGNRVGVKASIGKNKVVVAVHDDGPGVSDFSLLDQSFGGGHGFLSAVSSANRFTVETQGHRLEKPRDSDGLCETGPSKIDQGLKVTAEFIPQRLQVSLVCRGCGMKFQSSRAGQQFHSRGCLREWRHAGHHASLISAANPSFTGQALPRMISVARLAEATVRRMIVKEPRLWTFEDRVLGFVSRGLRSQIKSFRQGRGPGLGTGLKPEQLRSLDEDLTQTLIQKLEQVSPALARRARSLF